MSSLDIFKTAKMRRTVTSEGEASVEEAPLEGQITLPDVVTKEDVKKALPKDLKLKVSDELIQKLNSISQDPNIANQIRENFIGMTAIMKDGKFKFDHYLDACAYVTYKMMGYSNQDAYTLTFPDRVRRMYAEGKDEKYISSLVAAYHKNKLVNLIFDQSMIPSYILNQDLYQKALGRLSHLMMNAKSEKVQCDSAKSIVDALSQPEKSKVEIDMTMTDNTGIGELKQALVDIAKNQQQRIESGESTKQIAHQEIFDRNGDQVATT